MTKHLFGIDHEFSWDQMYRGVLPRDANPFRKAEPGLPAHPKVATPAPQKSSLAARPTPTVFAIEGKRPAAAFLARQGERRSDRVPKGIFDPSLTSRTSGCG